MQKILCRLIIIMCALLFGAAYACDTNQIDVLGDGTNCIDTKFSLTTTSLTLPDESEFRWYMSASGTFYVDCGTDGTLSGTGVVGKTITRTNTDEAQYTCTYTSGGTKTIQMAGLATGYNTVGRGTDYIAAIRFGDNNATSSLINSISGSLGQIYTTVGYSANQQPVFYRTFYGANRITNIPENLFLGVHGTINQMFMETFAACYSLVSIPENLFAGINGLTQGGGYKLFQGTFQGCTSLTSIPEDLFAGVSGYEGDVFMRTFYNCTSLRTIPSGLFRNVSYTWYGFYGTFEGCVSLQELPDGLFANISASGYEFVGTFANCTGLTGYIPPNFFAKMVADGSPYEANMMPSIFYNTGSLATTCPPGTTQYITGYEDYWNGHVSCVPEQFTCAAGKYLPAHGYQCETCPTGAKYCVGGTYNYSATDNNGIAACPVAGASTARTSYPTNYYNPTQIELYNHMFMTGISSIEGCTAQYNIVNARGVFIVEHIHYNSSTGKYDNNDGIPYYTRINPGYYGSERFRDSYCSGGGTYMLYGDAQPCPVGSYCPGLSSMPSCSSGTYNATIGIYDCPNDYPNSVSMASAQNQCYKQCTTTNVPHANAVIGNDYYDDGVDTCAPANANSCDTGYHYVSANGNNLPYCGANEITINWDDGNGGVDTTTCTYGGTITTPTVAPTKRGHTFLGWRFVAPSGN